ncbi:hypothetical protein DBR42_09845 [Pelomonas sp. HMWF004]|nr:hypothetical protein DBR42_09845 [Pelomonas sp. HMWF004]
MTQILTRPQANAVYSAMCTLNNVGARLSARRSIGTEWFSVLEDDSGMVVVWTVADGRPDQVERHASQSDFAAAYGLQAPEARPWN